MIVEIEIKVTPKYTDPRLLESFKKSFLADLEYRVGQTVSIFEREYDSNDDPLISNPSIEITVKE